MDFYREISSHLYSPTSSFLVPLPNFPLSFLYPFWFGLSIWFWVFFFVFEAHQKMISCIFLVFFSCHWFFFFFSIATFHFLLLQCLCVSTYTWTWRSRSCRRYRYLSWRLWTTHPPSIDSVFRGGFSWVKYEQVTFQVSFHTPRRFHFNYFHWVLYGEFWASTDFGLPFFFLIHSENYPSNVSIFSLLQYLQLTKNNIVKNSIIVDIRGLKIILDIVEWHISFNIEIVFRYLSTGLSYTAISDAFKIGTSTVHYVIAEVCTAIWDNLAPIHMPESTTSLLLRSFTLYM